MDEDQYEPLEDEDDSIRIFELDPGSESDPLSGDLIRTSLSNLNVPHYEALSYCWGNPTREAAVETPDGTLKITASLEAALIALRKKPPEAIICFYGSTPSVSTNSTLMRRPSRFRGCKTSTGKRIMLLYGLDQKQTTA